MWTSSVNNGGLVQYRAVFAEKYSLFTAIFIN